MRADVNAVTLQGDQLGLAGDKEPVGALSPQGGLVLPHYTEHRQWSISLKGRAEGHP